MLNLTAKELEKMLVESKQQAERLGMVLDSMQRDIVRLHKDRDMTEEGIKKWTRKAEAIQEALVITQGVSGVVSKLRKRFISNINRLKREDITISEQKSLQIETEELKRELRKNCSHPFVFHREGYSGTQSDDFEDGYPSERYCVVCGLGE